MATEEITISELELADEILGDMNIPVDTATETRAVTLKQLRAWLGSALPVGSIFASVGRLDDERFTLLDGKTISRIGTYEAFCNKVIEKVQAGTWKACTEEEFNLEVSETGQCGKFVVSNDYVRIPKLGNSLCSGVVDGKIPVVGNGKALGITNGATVGDLINGGGDTYNRVGLHLSSTLTNATLPQSNANIRNDYSGVSIGVVQDEQTSGIEGKINSVEVFYYMVVSTEGQTANVEIDINQVYEDMNLKANGDLSNVASVSQTFKELSVGWSMPDFTAEVSIPLDTYVLLPVDALVYGSGAESGYQIYQITVSLDGINDYIHFQQNGQYGGALGYYLPKGIYVKISDTCNKKSAYYPLKGVN